MDKVGHLSEAAAPGIASRRRWDRKAPPRSIWTSWGLPHSPLCPQTAACAPLRHLMVATSPQTSESLPRCCLSPLMRAGQGPGVLLVTPQSGERGLEKADPPPPDPGSRRAFCKFIRLSDLRGTVSHTRSKPLDIFNYKPCLGSTSISTSPRPPGGGSASPATCAGLRRGLALSRARSSGSCVLTPEPRPGGRQQRGGPKGLKHETAHRGLRSPPATWPGRFQMRGPLGTGIRGTLQRPLWVSLFPPLPGGSRPPHTHIAGDSAASGSWIPARFSCPTHTQD